MCGVMGVSLATTTFADTSLSVGNRIDSIVRAPSSMPITYLDASKLVSLINSSMPMLGKYFGLAISCIHSVAHTLYLGKWKLKYFRLASETCGRLNLNHTVATGQHLAVQPVLVSRCDFLTKENCIRPHINLHALMVRRAGLEHARLKPSTLKDDVSTNSTIAALVLNLGVAFFECFDRRPASIAVSVDHVVARCFYFVLVDECIGHIDRCIAFIFRHDHVRVGQRLRVSDRTHFLNLQRVYFLVAAVLRHRLRCHIKSSC